MVAKEMIAHNLHMVVQAMTIGRNTHHPNPLPEDVNGVAVHISEEPTLGNSRPYQI